MNKILGLDLGTNSIGWAIRDKMTNDTNQIQKYGVLTFNKGVGEGKSGEFSYAAQRTKKRSVRRLYQARKYRLWATLEVLIKEGHCPMKVEELDRWRKYDKTKGYKREYPVDAEKFEQWIKLDFDGDGKPDYDSPYQLRKMLATEKFDLTQESNKYKLGRALYHIAQRRGFKSSRKSSEVQAEKETNEEAIDLQKSEKKKNNELEKLYPEFADAKTVGIFFADKEAQGIRVRSDLTQYLIRENYKDEIKYIFDFQGLGLSHRLYNQLVESSNNKNDGAIFYKRPLRSQKGLIGLCTLEQRVVTDKKTGKPVLTGKYRCPVSHPAFEAFRAWCLLNNIKYKKPGDEGFQQLPMELKEEIYREKFLGRKKAYFPFSDIEDHLRKRGHNWTLNYKSKTTISGCPISARLKEIFGEGWQNLKIPRQPNPNSKTKKSHYDIEDVWHVLFSFEDQEYVFEYATNNLKLDEVKAKKFVTAWNMTPVGYAMLSLHGIRKINHFLRKGNGLIYTEAVLLANLPSIIGEDNWQQHEEELVNEISNIISKNRDEKKLLAIANNLVSGYKNLNQRFEQCNPNYALEESDYKAINDAILEGYGKKTWERKTEEVKEKIKSIIADCYQAYFKGTWDDLKYFGEDKHFVLDTNGYTFYKSTTGFYKMPRLIDSLAEFLLDHDLIREEDRNKIYHPSQIDIYPPAKPDKDGKLFLGSPKTGAFKNPMAMRTLHELRRIVNYLIESGEIDEETRVVVEVARDLNDANKRWAIEAYQRQREAENQEFAKLIAELKADPNCDGNAEAENDKDIDKVRLWIEQGDIDEIPEVSEKKDTKGLSWQKVKQSEITKYRLWKEQNHKCIYTGEPISLCDLFTGNVVDFEHTIPRSKSFDNSLANLTVCFHDFNRNVKKNRIPFQLNEYEAILTRIQPWQEKVEKIKAQVEFWKGKSKKASTKESKDQAIRQRHLWQFELDYWKNKVDRFTMEEITSGFKNSQKVDTQLISKYAVHYLKTVFEKVEVQKGAITAEFRKILELQPKGEKKDRTRLSHHAIDAATLTLIPIAAKRDAVLEEAFEYEEETGKQFHDFVPYKTYHSNHIKGIEENILVNSVTKDQALNKAKKKIRKRGKLSRTRQGNEMIATGDSVRAQLHKESLFGAIKYPLLDEEGSPIRDGNKYIYSKNSNGRETINMVIRISIDSFESPTDLDAIIDPVLKTEIQAVINKRLADGTSFKNAVAQPIWRLNKENEFIKHDKNGRTISPIRHVRCFVKAGRGYFTYDKALKVKKQTYLSAKGYKQFYYAQNDANYLYLLYENNTNGKTKRAYQIVSYFEARHINHINQLWSNEKFSSLKNGRLDFDLKSILKVGQRVIVKDYLEVEPFELSEEEIGKRLYFIYKFNEIKTTGFVYLQHHLEARPNDQIEGDSKEFLSDSYQARLRFGANKFNCLIEGENFEIMPDGKIKWLNT